ncbi:WW multi-domain protein [Pyrenophora teres f. maculata]|nr:WW multi-domain protein [Pyrenophora teres f. maculata]
MTTLPSKSTNTSNRNEGEDLHPAQTGTVKCLPKPHTTDSNHLRVAIPEARTHKVVNILNHPPPPWYHTDGPKSSILAAKDGITSTDRREEVNGTHRPTHRRAQQPFSLTRQCPVHITFILEQTRTEHGQILSRSAPPLALVSMDNIWILLSMVAMELADEVLRCSCLRGHTWI